MKDWEIIAKNISNRGWTLGWVSGVGARGRTIWITDAHRNGKRFIVHADEKLTAFAELETSIFKRAKIRWENVAIRQAVLRAAAQEQRKCEFKLFGRGHESRVTLSVSVAAILRSLDIPRVYISGYGANYRYPTRVFATANKILEKKLGRSPIVLSLSYRVYRIRTTAKKIGFLC